MKNADIQDVIDAHLNAVKDGFVDDAVLMKLRHTLLSSTRATRVSVTHNPADNSLDAKVTVSNDVYDGHVELKQFVPQLHQVDHPAHVEYVATHDERTKADENKGE